MIFKTSFILITQIAIVVSCGIDCQLCLEATNFCAKCKPGYYLIEGDCKKSDQCDNDRWRQNNSGCIDKCNGLQLWNFEEGQENVCFLKVECPEYSKPEELDLWSVGYFYPKGKRSQVKVKVIQNRLQVVLSKTNEIISEYTSQQGNIIEIQIIENSKRMQSSIFGRTTSSLIILSSQLNQPTSNQQQIELQLTSGQDIKKLFAKWEDQSLLFIIVSSNLNELIIKTFDSQIKTQQDALSQKISSIKSVNQINYVDETMIIGTGESLDGKSIITFSINYQISSFQALISHSSFCSLLQEQEQININYIVSKQLILINSNSQIYLLNSSQSQELQQCTFFLSILSIEQIQLVNDQNQILIISQQNILLYSVQDLLTPLSIIKELDKRDNSQYQLQSCLIYQPNEILCFDISKLNLYLITINAFKILSIQSLQTLNDAIIQISIEYPSIFIHSEKYSIHFPEIQSTSLSLGACYYNIYYSGTSQEFNSNLNQINLFISNEPFEVIPFRFLIITLESDLSQSDIEYLSNANQKFILIFLPLFSKQQLNFNSISTLKHGITLQDFTLYIDGNYNFQQQDYISIINVDLKLTSQKAQLQLNYYHSFSLENVFISGIQLSQPLFILNTIQNFKITNVTISECLLFAPLISTNSVNQIYMNGLNIMQSLFFKSFIIQVIDTSSFLLINSNFINNKFKNPLSTAPPNTADFGLIFQINGIDNMYIYNTRTQFNLNIRSIDYSLSYQMLGSENIIIKSQSQLILQNNTFESNICTHCQLLSFVSITLYLSENTFINNYSLLSNGTLLISQSISYIQSSIFHNNTAYSGGALFLNRTYSAQIISSTITNNTAITTGGGVIFIFALGVLNSTVVQYNKAMIGGGIRIEDGKLVYVHWDSNCIINHNHAIIYGQNVISRLVRREIYINKIKMEELNDFEVAMFNMIISQFEKDFIIQNGLKISNIHSGGQIEILIKLYDVDGKQFSYDPTILYTYPLKIQQDIKSILGLFQPLIAQFIGQIQIDKFSVELGGFLLILTVYGAPSKTLPLYFFENFIEFITKDSQISRVRNLHQKIIEESIKKEYFVHKQQHSSQQVSKISRILLEIETIIVLLNSPAMTSTGIFFSFRDCLPGEIFKEVNQRYQLSECFSCPLNSYSITYNSTSCKKCPDQAQICENNTIILKDGYWRSNLTSDEIYKCSDLFNRCQEYTLRSSQQQCAQGMIGQLCEGCDITGEYWGKSYTKRNLEDSCVECDTGTHQQVKIILIFIFTSIYLTFLIWIIIMGNIQHSIAYYLRMMSIVPISNSQKRESSQYIKILVHYLQIIAIINEVSYQMPASFNFIQMLTGNPSSSMIFAASCFYKSFEITNTMEQKVIFSTILPVVYFLSASILLYLLKLIKNIKLNEFQFILPKMIILALFFQPDTVMFLLSAVGCRQLGDKLFLIADANYECYDTQNYKSFLYSFTIPSLLIWSLFPIFILYFLKKQKLNLNSAKIIKIYGYLYLEYKPNFYFFEFIRSYFKLVIAAIYVLINFSRTLKLDCIMLLISLYLIFLNKLKPFQNYFLSLVDSITHFTLLVILLLLLLKENKNDNDSEKINIICKIISLTWFFLMMSIICLTKLKEYPKILNQIISILKHRFGKYIGCLKYIKFNTPEKNSKVLKRWRFIRQNIQNIIFYHFNQICCKSSGNIPNFLYFFNNYFLEILPQQESQKTEKQNFNGYLKKKGIDFHITPNIEIIELDEECNVETVNQEDHSPIITEMQQYTSPKYELQIKFTSSKLISIEEDK